MKIKVNKDFLNKALTFLQTGVPAKAMIPSDYWVLFSITGDRCDIKVSSAGCELKAYVKVKSDIDGTFACPMHRMARTVATFPDGEINITTKDNDLGFIGSIHLKPQGQRKKYQIACLPASEFTNWGSDTSKEIVTFNAPMRDFYNKMKIISGNIQSNNPDSAFSNITLFKNNLGKLSLITGDAHIICKLDLPPEIPESMIVDRTLAKLMSTLNDDGDCEVIITEGTFYLSYGGLSLKCKMVDRKVPGYQALFDHDPDDKFVINKEDVMQSLTRIATYNDETNLVNMNVKKEFIKFYANDGNNEAEEILDIENNKKIEIEVDMNHVYLRSAISGIKSEKVEIGMGKTGYQIFLKPIGENKDNQTWMFAPYNKG